MKLKREVSALGSTSRSEYYDKMLAIYHELMHKLLREMRPDLMQLMHFFNFHVFSLMKFFDQSLPHEHRDNFYMEREWRLIGNLQFRLDDVYRVILPTSFAKKFRADLPEYCGQLTCAEDSGQI